MDGTSKVCHLYVFLVNNMKLRKKVSDGWKKSVKKELGGHKNQNFGKSNWQKFNIIKTKLLSVAFFDTNIFVAW